MSWGSLVVALGLALWAPVASAQSLAGISVGDREAKVVKAFPDATSVAVDDNPQHRMIFVADVMVWACKGVVYSVQQEGGSTLTDYLTTVERETAKRGKPASRSQVWKAGAKTQSALFSEWPDHDKKFSVEFLYTGEKHLVISSITGDSQC